MENKNCIIHFEECTKTNISILLDCALRIMFHYELCQCNASWDTRSVTGRAPTPMR